jgi:hypothetical protein
MLTKDLFQELLSDSELREWTGNQLLEIFAGGGMYHEEHIRKLFINLEREVKLKKILKN